MFQSRSQWSARIGLILIAGILYYYFSPFKPTVVEEGPKPTLLESVIPFLVLAIILYLRYLYYRHKSYLNREGIPGTATVVKIFTTGISIGNDNDRQQYEIIMNVNESGSTTYRTTIKKYFYPDEPVPESGTVVKVKIHPKDKDKMVID